MLVLQRIGNQPGTDAQVLARAKYVALDLEMTGLSLTQDRILEIGGVFCDERAKPIATVETLINPERDTGKVEIHGITDEMVLGAPKFCDIACEFANILDEKIIVGHNSSTDFYMMKNEFGNFGTLFKPGKSIDLRNFLNDDDFTTRYEKILVDLLINSETEHRALPDAKVVAQILPCIVEYIRDSTARAHQFHPCSFPTKAIMRTLQQAWPSKSLKSDKT